MSFFCLLPVNIKVKTTMQQSYFSSRPRTACVFSAVGEGGGVHKLLCPSLCFPALAETFSVIGFPHLPRVCFLLTFNMFNRSLVIVPKTIKPVWSIKMIHIQNTLVFCCCSCGFGFVKFFLIIFSVKSCGRSKKGFLHSNRNPLKKCNQRVVSTEAVRGQRFPLSVLHVAVVMKCGLRFNLMLCPQKKQKLV